MMNSFSAKSNTIVKLSVPSSSTTEMFSMALSKGSSSVPMFSLTKAALDRTLCQ